MTGKKNMVFGFFYFLLTLGLGMYLSRKLGSGPEWAASQQRAVLRAAHAHGNLESLLNVVVGYLLCRLAVDAWIAKTVSVILIIGALLHSGILYLGGFGFSAGFKLTPIGAVLVLVSMLLMGIGVARLKSVD
jgi:uncharacterized membrane protein YgdD (TMEM256/DUF423 family)